MKNTEDVYTKMEHGFVETSSGTRFSLADPEFLPEDIAHALSMNCRFNGHTSAFYSVAEHSLLVADLVDMMGGNYQQRLEALLHDATEAYLSDVPAPFKQFLPDWRKLDADLDAKLREWADLPKDKTGLVKEADWYALFIEAYYLLPDGGQCFIDPDGLRNRALELMEKYAYKPMCMNPKAAKLAFLHEWAYLAPDRPA